MGLGKVLRDKIRLDNISQQLGRDINELKEESISEYVRELINNSNIEQPRGKETKTIKRPNIHVQQMKEMNDNQDRHNVEKIADMLHNQETSFIHNLEDKQVQKTNITEETLQDTEKIVLVRVTKVKNKIKNNKNLRKPKDLIY